MKISSMKWLLRELFNFLLKLGSWMQLEDSEKTMFFLCEEAMVAMYFTVADR